MDESSRENDSSEQNSYNLLFKSWSFTEYENYIFISFSFFYFCVENNYLNHAIEIIIHLYINIISSIIMYRSTIYVC